MTGIFQAGVADAMGVRTSCLQLPGMATDSRAGGMRKLLYNAPFQGGLSKVGWRLKWSPCP